MNFAPWCPSLASSTSSMSILIPCSSIGMQRMSGWYAENACSAPT